MASSKRKSRTDLGAAEKGLPGIRVKPSSEPMYFAFVVWGAVITAVLYFLGYGYLTFYNQEFGIEMEDFSYYEVLLKSYNVIKIMNPKLLAFLILTVSVIYTVILLIRRRNEYSEKIAKKTGTWILIWVVPVLSLLFAGGVWFFFRGAFETAREAGFFYAQYVKTHLSEQNKIAFIFDSGAETSIPAFIKESNTKWEFRLVARSKLSYYVMRQPAEGVDNLVYEIPRAKVNLMIINK